ncbi:MULTISPECIES: hypothetical protein [Bacillus cereus group]|uniref:hypothetical protein n=1 Tax=Bacillus cereus group TaxID=86661 RepID=UPI0001A10F83|nr:hypothetical protein bcere0029_53630 [Bacillus cereus AH1272]EEL90206.1 hypothetical protein bcere0030_58810 [Bacillus cereus AH1273]MDA1569781.1 hypothetical protein [Bacillus cereus]
MRECKCCWEETEDVLCEGCAKLSILEQIDFKDYKLEQIELDYVGVKVEIEAIGFERVKNMYECTEEDLLSWLLEKCEEIERLKKEIRVLKQHPDVRLKFMFEKEMSDEERHRYIVSML